MFGPLWTGCVLSTLPVLLLLFSAFSKLSRTDEVVERFAKNGYPESALLWIGVAELACTVLYAIPQTAVLGAILLTGYLGGATDVHVRSSLPIYIPILVGVVVWLGLYFRDARLRELVPVRR